MTIFNNLPNDIREMIYTVSGNTEKQALLQTDSGFYQIALTTKLDRRDILINLINDLQINNQEISLEVINDTKNTFEINLIDESFFEIKYTNGGKTVRDLNYQYFLKDDEEDDENDEDAHGGANAHPPYLLTCSTTCNIDILKSYIMSGFDPKSIQFDHTSEDETQWTNYTAKNPNPEAKKSLIVNFLKEHSEIGYLGNRNSTDVQLAVEYINETNPEPFFFTNVLFIKDTSGHSPTPTPISAVNKLISLSPIPPVPPAKGGGSKEKIFVLGRHRCVTKVGRKQMITYQNKQISITEARKLEKQTNKKKLK